MEIDNARGFRSFMCNLKGHQAKQCRKVNSVENRSFGCGEGHIPRNCKAENSYTQGTGHGRPFYRCKKVSNRNEHQHTNDFNQSGNGNTLFM
jgi:hypothetical protein